LCVHLGGSVDNFLDEKLCCCAGECVVILKMTRCLYLK
jgi:hypothetical protein